MGPHGLHGLSNGCPLGTLRCQISAQFMTLVASWFQSRSQDRKKSYLGSLWSHFGVRFRRILIKLWGYMLNAGPSIRIRRILCFLILMTSLQLDGGSHGFRKNRGRDENVSLPRKVFLCICSPASQLCRSV